MLQIQFLPTRHGSAYEVRLVGELDRFSADTVVHCLAGLAGDIELDCSELDAVDSGGLSALLAVREACDARGDRLVLRDLAPPPDAFPGWYRVEMFETGDGDDVDIDLTLDDDGIDVEIDLTLDAADALAPGDDALASGAAGG
jgi:anti-anti-sigma regulatory factor